MTICIAAMCQAETSLVLATDTMVTNPGISIEFEHPSRKLTALAENCIALTAGDALAHSELFTAVREHINQFRQPSVSCVVATIKKCYQELRRQEICERLLLPRGLSGFEEFYERQRLLLPEIVAGIQSQIDDYNYGLEILVAGTTGQSAHIYSVLNPGTSQCYDAIHFHAIGSGTPHALNTMIARGCNAATSLLEALMIVFDAKSVSENAPGVGLATDIAVMMPDGSIHLSRQSIDQLRDVHRRWVRQETSWKTDLTAILRKEQTSHECTSSQADATANVSENADRSPSEIPSEGPEIPRETEC